VPLDFLVVQAFDAYEFERFGVPAAHASDFLLVNLFRGAVGAPMRPDAVGALIAAAGRRAGLALGVTPHQLRHVLSATPPPPWPAASRSPKSPGGSGTTASRSPTRSTVTSCPPPGTAPAPSSTTPAALDRITRRAWKPHAEPVRPS